MHSPTIGIDCSPLLVRSAGVKTYLYHWIRSLRNLHPDAIRTFLAPGDSGELLHEGGPRMHPLQIAGLLALNRLPRIACTFAAPRCDIFHASNLLRRLPAGPKISATIHDLTAWVLPESHTSVLIAAEKAFAERVLKRAAGLIADSENTKKDAVEILRIPEARIRVIPLGVPPTYRDVKPEAAAVARNAYKLRHPYFLSVGTIEPRKNIDTLLTAWNRLPAGFRAEHQLAIVGMPGWRSEHTMARIHQAAGEKCGIRYLGYVPESDLPGLTAGAQALVYPSLYEGFGIPVAQAMAAACPVITSNVSSLPEITGQAAILIDPASADELSAAIRTMGESTELRSRLAAEGVERSQRYTWEAAAAASFRYFAELV